VLLGSSLAARFRVCPFGCAVLSHFFGLLPLSRSAAPIRVVFATFAPLALASSQATYSLHLSPIVGPLSLDALLFFAVVDCTCPSPVCTCSLCPCFAWLRARSGWFHRVLAPPLPQLRSLSHVVATPNMTPLPSASSPYAISQTLYRPRGGSGFRMSCKMRVYIAQSEASLSSSKCYPGTSREGHIISRG